MADEQDTTAQDQVATTDPATSDTAEETLGEAGLKALQRERDARKALERELADLRPLAERARELEESQKTEQQKLAERAERAEAELAATQARLLRQDIAARKGLPLDMAARLQGSTPEELDADADALLSLIAAQPKPAAPPVPAHATALEPSAGDGNDWLRRFAGARH